MVNETSPGASPASQKHWQCNLAEYYRWSPPFYNSVLANDAYKAYTAETGVPQEATVPRDKAWNALEEWMLPFYRQAKIALKKAPQLREKLGMIER